MTEPLLAGRVLGGRGVHATDVPEHEPHPAVPTAILEFDSLTSGGLRGGSLWTFAGPSGAGVTQFVTRLAAGVAHRGTPTLLVNGHLRTRLLLDRAQRLLERIAQATHATDLNVASWWPLPWPDPANLSTAAREDWQTDGARLLVLDTVDEMVITHAEPPSPAEWQQVLRHLRRRAEQLELSIVLTARLPDDAWTPVAARAALNRHAVGSALIDVSDVVALLVERTFGPPTMLHVIHNRLGPCGVVPIGQNRW